MQCKPLFWVGSSYKDLKRFPKFVQQIMGYALHMAQCMEHHPKAKILKGFGGGGIVEIVADDREGTFRVVYTVRVKDAIYVLHAFQKKSKTGIKTTKQDIDLIRSRLQEVLDERKDAL